MTCGRGTLPITDFDETRDYTPFEEAREGVKQVPAVHVAVHHPLPRQPMPQEEPQSQPSGVGGGTLEPKLKSAATSTNSIRQRLFLGKSSPNPVRTEGYIEEYGPHQRSTPQGSIAKRHRIRASSSPVSYITASIL